jgi:hypothetical protein
MIAYEFATRVSADGKLLIPARYANQLPIGNSVRVIILVNELASPHHRSPDSLFTLAEVIAEIQNTPQSLTNVTPAKKFTETDVENWIDHPDPAFDVMAWNQEWDKVEADMKARELAEEQWEAEKL